MQKTDSILDQILERKALEVKTAKQLRPLSTLKSSLAARKSSVRDFSRAISKPGSVSVIAEIKKASPSAGVICEDFDPVQIGRAYQSSSMVNAISVLTDKDFFQGDLRFIAQVKAATTLPIFRKDFIIDEYQVYESFLAESDALLLIAAALDEDELRHLLQVSQKLGMSALVETHTAPEIQRALAAGASIIGINARSLHTFEMNAALFEELVPLIPDGVLKVAESGIETVADVQRVSRAGADAVLVGTSIMKASNKHQKLADLLGRERERV